MRELQGELVSKAAAQEPTAVLPERWASVEAMLEELDGELPVAPDLGFIARLPIVDPFADPTDASAVKPLPMRDVIRLIPGFDPFRLAGECYFDEEAAERAIDFFHECCTHTKGPLGPKSEGERGTPLILQLWQQAIIANLFGWKRADGSRRFTDVFVYVPRKNGKTTMISGLVLFMLFCDGEPGAEVYSAAAEKGQAALVFDVAKVMVEREPELDSRGRVFRALKAIEYADAGSVYKAISSDADTKHGFNSSCYVMDELHAQKNRHLLDALETSTDARENPLGVIITTADFEGPSICNEKLAYAENVRDGVLDDDGTLPVVFKAGREDEWRSPDTWRRANPNLGVSFTMQKMQRAFMKAAKTPDAQNTFRRLRLNVNTQSEIAAIEIEQYEACTDLDFDFAELKHEPCFGALDLASTSDLTCFALWFPDRELSIEWYFLPEETAKKRAEKDQVPYLTWGRQKSARLLLTPGNSCDYGFVRRTVQKVAAHVKIESIAFDRWNASQLVTDLQGDGFDMVAFGQGFASMSAPTKDLLARIADQKCRHDGNPVSRWCAANLILEEDAAGNVKPSKKRSRDKIDGMVARIMALGVSILRAGKKKTSAYKSRGLRRLGR